MNQINLRGSFYFLTKVICFQKIYLFLIIIIISFSLTTLKDEWRRDTLSCACVCACMQAYNEKRKDIKTRKTCIMYNRKERRAKEKKRETDRAFIDEDFFSLSIVRSLSRLPVRNERKYNVFFVVVLQTRLLLLFEPSDKRKT